MQELVKRFIGDNIMTRLLTSAICFSFIYIWHGTMDHVLIWSFLNFTGVILEALARHLGRNPKYIQFEVLRIIFNILQL